MHVSSLIVVIDTYFTFPLSVLSVMDFTGPERQLIQEENENFSFCSILAEFRAMGVMHTYSF